MRPRGKIDRREFVEVAAVAGAAAATGAWARAFFPHAAGSDRIRVGLIGCGGRGTGAATQALNADSGNVLHAMGDAFPDRLDGSLSALKGEMEARGPDGLAQIDVPEERRFVGLDSYKSVAECCDVVLLTSVPHFRPIHLKAAVEAGRHIFCEKPVAVDSAGLRSVMQSVEAARQKNLSLVCGFCWRYSARERDVYKRIHDGAIGDIRAVYTTYNAGGFPEPRPRQPAWSDMEFQLRNWHYFTWLSGDHIVEQAVHAINKAAWAMQDRMPRSVICSGGRQVRPDRPETGNIYDHFAATYEYADGSRFFHMCRHFPNCASDNSDYILGSKGTATIDGWKDLQRIEADGKTWQSDVPRNDMYQQEHDELFASIRAGKPMNDGDWMTKSCAMAIMARMSAYTGQAVTWDQVMTSKEDLSPAAYEFGPLPPPAPVAMPGRTKLI